MFSKPPAGPVVLRSHVPGESRSEGIDMDDAVKVKIGTEMMTIVGLEDVGYGKLKGLIESFDNLDTEWNGFKIGGGVIFERTDVWVILKR
jgi:hypothetical protein